MGRVSDTKERLIEAVLELIWFGSYGSTTIDQICERAGVKKGSFYYFFDSKAELAVTALEADWERRRPALDGLFSATVAPIQRLKNYCEHIRSRQIELKQKHGYVLGCPVFTVGAEICTQDPKLRAKVEELLGHYREYLESTIREAHVLGLVDAPNAAAKAQMLFAYYEGLLTQARILNDVAVLQQMAEGTAAVLGIKLPIKGFK